MTEKEKMIAGEMYNPNDEILSQDRFQTRIHLNKINTLSVTEKIERDTVFKALIPNGGEKLYIEPPFYCDYGYNIKTGNNVYMNFNCCILDVSTVTIGDNCMFGPNVQIYTATHPLEFKARNSGKELAKPITVGENVWIGGNATICPGVTIGNNVVIGAGSVVTKSFPDDVFIAGNPAKVIKTIDNS